MGGANNPFLITQIEGLAKPEVRSGNTDRPRTRGAYVGLNLLKSRLITVTMDVGPPFGSFTNLAGALAALRTASSTEGTAEYPLWVQLPNLPLVCCYARMLRREVKWDVAADLGSLAQGVPVQFEVTDPYFYGAPTTNSIVSLPAPAGGFSFPITFPLSFGGGSSPNQVTAFNAGDVPCWPVLVITGPCLNPSVSNQSIAGNPTLQFGMQLNPGDQLVVDCDLQSVVFTPSGASVGAAYPQVVQSGSTFFSLASGSNVVAFNSQDTAPAAGTLGMWWTSAFSGLL